MMLARLALVGICPGGRRASPWPLRPGIWGSAGCDRNCRRSGCGYDARTSMSTTTSRSQAQVRCHAVRRLVEPAVFHDGDESALVLQHTHVARRVAFDPQSVSEVALADQAEFVAQAHALPPGRGGGADRLHRREAQPVYQDTDSQRRRI